MYSANDIKFTVSVKEYDVDLFGQKTKPCEPNNGSNHGGQSPKYYYVKLSVQNNTPFEVVFTTVPTVSIRLKDFNNQTPHEACKNFASPSISVSFDVRKMGPYSKITFDDKKQGDWSFGRPSFEYYTTSNYMIKNPIIKRWPTWAKVDYKTYAEQRGKPIVEDDKKKKENSKKTAEEKDELDDFVNGLEDDFNKTESKIKDETKDYVDNKTSEKAKKVGVISKNSGTTTTTSNNKTNKTYSAVTCQNLKNQANTVYKSIASLLRQSTKGNVDYAMSQSNRMRVQMERFSKDYLNAVKANQLSPKCQSAISNIMERYTNQFMRYLNKYSSGILKN